MVPSVDKEENFYMSKTKTGIDHLAENSVKAGEEMEQKLAEIKSRQAVRDNIEASPNRPSEIEKTNKMMVEMDEKIQEISQKAIILDKEYSRYNSKNYITLNTDSRGYLSRSRLLQSLAVSVVIHGGMIMRMIYKSGKHRLEE